MPLTRLVTLAALPLFLATTAMAQVFPTRADGPVTDDAQLIEDAVEARLVTRLNALREDGVSVDIVTLPRSTFYTEGTETRAYANLLAQNFGLPAQTGDKWALMVIFPEDRAYSVATGPAYAGQDAEISRILAEVMPPQFQNNAYGAGIEAGVEALVAGVLNPGSAVALPAASVPAESGGNGLYWLLGGLVVVVGGIVALVKRGNAKFARQPCSACGKTGLTRERVTLVEPTLKTEGQGETRITCPSCGHVERQPYTIAKTRPEGRAQTADAAGKRAPEAPRTKAGMPGHSAPQPPAPPVKGQAQPPSPPTQGGGASGNW